MNDSLKPDDIDPVIHERVRLAIVSALAPVLQVAYPALILVTLVNIWWKLREEVVVKQA